MSHMEKKYPCLNCDHNIPLSTAQHREGYVPTPQYCETCKIELDRQLDDICDEDLHFSLI